MSALTVLAHHDKKLVSSWCFLAPVTQVGRSEPEFQGLDGVPVHLDDPFVSRTPFILESQGDGVWLRPNGTSTQILVDGVPITDSVYFDGKRVNTGVVLCLSGRVTLLLHKVGAPRIWCEKSFDLVGSSEALTRVRRDIDTVAGLDVPVLIRGESGSGKELIARAIHENSRRSAQHYEAINMAALVETLAASELFGHKKGAFTGADKNKDGCFTRADRGTLFMDEVGDTPGAVQPQLLRVLETWEVMPVGASAAAKVDVRLIAATDADLEGAIQRGDFREALLQRLAGYQILVPPLRDRRDDIGALIIHFARHELENLGRVDLIDQPDVKRPWLSASLVARLARHDWPGNVRQLRNVVRQLVISGYTQSRLRANEELEKILGPSSPQTDETTLPPPDEEPAAARPAAPRYRDPSEVGEDELVETLKAHGWRLTPAAKALNVSRTSLYAMVESSTRIRKGADLTMDEITAALQAHGSLSKAAEHLAVSTHALKLRMRALNIQK